MNLKPLLVGMLSACMIGSSIAPTVMLQAKEPDVVVKMEVEETPEVLLEQMGRDVKLKDFIRPIRPRDLIQFQRKVKKYFTKMDVSAQELTSSYDLAMFDSACTGKEHGSIGVAPARLNGEDVTLIALGGTNIKEGQATGFKEDILSALGKSNQYLRNVVALFDEVDEYNQPIIPEDKPVIVTGISLGGMVAQQLLGQKELLKRFDIQQIICFGSPLLEPFKRNDDTRVVRFCDTMDIVPYLGRSAMVDFIRQELLNKDPLRYIQALDEKEVLLGDGGYRSPVSAHMFSYIEGKCWKQYDVLGVYEGNNELVTLKPLQFFENPTE